MTVCSVGQALVSAVKQDTEYVNSTAFILPCLMHTDAHTLEILFLIFNYILLIMLLQLS